MDYKQLTATVDNQKKLANEKWKYFCATLALFFIQNLYGAECGVVKHYINQCSYVEISSEHVFVNIIKEALGINNIRSPQEAINIMDELFKAFNKRKEKDKLQQTQLGGKNLAFYRGKAYINGLIPTNYGYDNLYLKNAKRPHFQVVQLYEVIGFDKVEAQKIEDMTRIRDNSAILMESSVEFYIRCFWNDIKGKTNFQIDALLQEQLQKYKKLSQEYDKVQCIQEYEKIKATADYAKSLHNLGIDTKNLELTKDFASNVEKLHELYRKATKMTYEILEKYFEEFGKYVSYFSIDDSVEFLNEIHQLSKAPSAIDTWIGVIRKPEYNRYTHTEYMIRYIHRNESTPLCMISFYDVCKSCEKMLAETTTEESWKYNTLVVSAQEYANSRIRERLDDQTNFSLLLMQLHPKYFDNPFESNTPPTHINKRAFEFASKATPTKPPSLVKTVPTPNKRRRIQQK